MRTTIDVDDEVLAAARSLAQVDGLSLGAAVSELARRGLRTPSHRVDVAYSRFPLLIDTTGHTVTDELVAAHRDD